EHAHAGGGGRIARGLARELAWFPFQLARRVRRERLDLLHCLSPNMPRRAPVPVVATIHDVLPWSHPHWMTRANVLQHRFVVAPGLRHAGAVVVPSDFTRAELVARLGVEPGRVVVAPIGVDPRFSPGGGPADRADPYVLTVGTLQPRKDLAGALAAFDRVVAAGLPHRL